MGEVEGKDGGREADERLESKREGTSDKGVEVDRKKEGERKKGEMEGERPRKNSGGDTKGEE
jgi:hypothetical protein